MQAALLSTGGCGVTTAARDHKRGSTLRAQRGRRMARRAHAACVWTCCWCEIVGGEIGNDEVQRENGLVRGGAQHRRRVGAACVLDWAREQGRVDDWRKVALSCVGLQRVAGSAKAVSWRHGALEEDNASLALAGCAWLVEWQTASAAT